MNHLNHKAACSYCHKFARNDIDGEIGCTIYDDTTWVNRRGGCPNFPLRDLPEAMKKRVGQQKQKHSDPSYHSKNDRKSKFRSINQGG
jgi:hypothetical protein